MSSLILTLILTTTSSMYDKIIDLNLWKTSCTDILPKLCPIIDSWKIPPTPLRRHKNPPPHDLHLFRFKTLSK
jgi:hypothetical protein